MRPRRYVPDTTDILVADASVWINLVATGRAAEHLRAIRKRFVITDVALGELEKGRTKGRQTADEVIALIHLGLVDVMRHRPEDDDLFLGLIAGKAVETLDDGEADTLVVANSCGCIAVIDERKATIIAARKFPHLNLRTTVDLLLSTEVIETLGLEIVCDSLHRALVSARMRIPEHHLAEVLRLIGPERAKACTSLPAAHRRGS